MNENKQSVIHIRNEFNNFIFITIFCLIILGPKSISAQSKFQFGPTVGLGISSMHDRTPNDKTWHGHTGILGSFSINEKLKLQPALIISSKGYGSTLIHPDKSVDLTYIDAIVTLKYLFWKSFFAGLGVQAGYLNKAHYSYEFYYDTPKTVNIKNITYDFDYGVSGSIGYQFKSGIGLELAIVYGIRDVFNEHSNEPVVSFFNNAEYIPAQAKGKNTVISFSFYALFGKKKKISNNY